MREALPLGGTVSARGTRGLPAGTPAHIVVRPRLIRLLDEAVGGSQLTLVCAPAGFGKSALVSMWATLRSTSGLLLWVSADGGRGRRTFWHWVARGLRDAPDGDGRAVNSVDRRQLAAFVRRIARRSGPVVIVVDEGSGPSNRALHRELDGYLRHAGDAVRLVLVTRTDPVMPLRNYRLDQTLSEVRAEDLAFTSPEAAELLDRAGTAVTADQVDLLLEKTSGWAAGLVFAAQFLQDAHSLDEAVEEFTGSERAVSDFLMKEFLDAQPANVRDVLLRSSVADEFPVGLFEELTGAQDGEVALSFLNRANAFLSPAPGTASSYQYPPLLREFLRTRLAYERPALVPVLHDAAARWWFRQGSVHAAIRHAVTAGHWDDAAGYAVHGLVVGELLNERVDTTVEALLDLPPGSRTPPAAVVRAAVALRNGDPAQARRVVAELRTTLADASAEGHSVEDSDELMLFCLELLQAGIAALDNDAEGGLETVRRAERHLHKLHPSSQDLPVLRGLIATYRARLQVWGGDVPAARASLEEVAAAARAAEETAWEVYALAQEAVLAAIMGDFDAALALATRADGLREEQVSLRADDQARIALARAWVMTERSLLGPARDQIARVDESLPATDPVSRGLIAVARSRLLHSQGYHSAAARVMAFEQRRLPVPPGWVARWVEIAGEVQRTSQGMRGAVEGEAHALDLQLPGWQGDPPLGFQVTGRIFEADSALLAGDEEGARNALASALDLAAPRSLRRPFLESPPAVRQLLRTREDLRARHRWLVPDEDRSDQGSSVARTVPRQRGSAEAMTEPATGPAASAGRSQFGMVFVEALTTKEREVLGHLADLKTTEEIAAEMFISVNTVRTHVRNLLRKLGVDRRNQAVRRARELGILPGSLGQSIHRT